MRTTFPAIAERQGIPRKFLPTVLQSLIQAGFGAHHPRIWRRRRAGLRSDEITVRQIIESVEGRQQLYDCESRNIDCTMKADCLLRDVLERAGNAMLDVLEQTTLADLVPGFLCADSRQSLAVEVEA